MIQASMLLLNKSSGMTSFDCIRRLKKILHRTDLGHGGTLDRFATGLLPILMGDGLKFVRFFLESYPLLPTYWKTYAGIIELGTATETGDPEGKVIATQPVRVLDRAQVEPVMRSFVEQAYEQIPPDYSAKKVGGKRAAELARKGKKLDLKPIAVTIRTFTCHAIEENRIHFEVTCSKGGYVRVLAQDLARKLGTVGHVCSLQRTAIGDWSLSQAHTLDEVEEWVKQNHLGTMTKAESRSTTDSQPETTPFLNLTQTASFLPTFSVLPNEQELVRMGKTSGLTTRLANSGLKPNAYCATLEDHQPIALLELSSQKQARFLRSFIFT